MLREHYAPGEVPSSPTSVDSTSPARGLVTMCKEGIRKVSDYLDEEKREQQKRLHSISMVLERLERREHEMGEQLAGEMDDTIRKNLEKKLSVIFAQKNKGLAAIEGLKHTQTQP